ncbi:MAG: RNA methyltransferase [Paludibacteraceae bacterium]|nr:RNA methyltransferase [Paludibacteraceae bacterium]
MKIIRIDSLQHPGVDVYASLTEAQLCDSKLSGNGLFIAESGKVIDVALRAGYQPVSLLTEEKHLTGYAQQIIERIEAMEDSGQLSEMPVYVGTRELLSGITGYPLTRSILCAMQRKPLPSVEQLCANTRRIAILDGVVDTTNIGAIFRSAAALDVDALLLTPQSCDPLNRRAVRVSMGNVFLVPWTWLTTPVTTLHDYGFTTAALALRSDNMALDDPRLKQIEKLALVLGTEGDGLAEEVISQADYVIRIPMAHGVDSLNVAAASAVAFWELRKTDF